MYVKKIEKVRAAEWLQKKKKVLEKGDRIERQRHVRRKE